MKPAGRIELPHTPPDLYRYLAPVRPARGTGVSADPCANLFEATPERRD